MKKHFVTGLALLLPLVLTLLVVWFLVNLLTKPFLGFAHEILQGFGFSSDGDVVQVFARVLILAVLLIAVVVVGFLGRIFIARLFFGGVDTIVEQIPVVNKIYKAAQDVVQTLFASQEKKFTQVVLVPFPERSSLSLGFVTNECLPEGSDRDHEGMLSVFVPGTPNPMMGFMLMFARKDVVFIDMKVDAALKVIISCGVMSDRM